ncbi:lamin tail domain-containing protein [Neolewinella sp.]|uniref:lamin tail domain-containing protein n=1 Tax=Neolewinella sp. TaxID=2993543 RepID=UPI003B51E2AB
MNVFSTRHLLTLLLLYALCTCGRAQDTLYIQDFEGEREGQLPYTTNVPPYGSGGLPTWNVVPRIKGIDTAYAGEHFWAARDVDNALASDPVGRLVFDAGEICNLTSARFVFAYTVVGYDGGDDFGYELYLDGFLHERVVLVDGRNGGGVSTDGWVTDTVRIPGTAQTARLEVYFDQNGDDVAGLDDLQLLASGTDGSCNAVCGVKLRKSQLDCSAFTAAADGVRLSLPYRGAEAGVTVTVDGGGTVTGDDPARVQDGKIVVEDLLEGQSYIVRVSGGDCDLELPIDVPADQCAPSDLVINEVLADPGEDVNQDGKVNAGDEFVEIYNVGDRQVEVGGFTLHDGSNSGPRFTFPEGAVLGPQESFVVFAGKSESLSLPCEFGIASGFLGLNNDSPETVTLRNPAGRVVAQAAFDDAPDGESLTLHPDGNTAGGYRPYTSVDPAVKASPCASVVAAPVELLYFTATSMQRAVRLDWATASEQDNAGFVLERSKAGRVFTEIGRMPAGDGTYVYVDNRPFPGQNLYRLRQRDFDGTETVYGPISVRLDSGTIALYPNPATSKVHLTGGIDPQQPVVVYRSDGRVVTETRGATIDVSAFPAGSYYLRLRRGSDATSLRFIKE